MFRKEIKFTFVFLGLVGASLFAKDFAVKQQWPDSVLVFAAARDHVAGHTDGQIDKLAKSKDMYQAYREPVAVTTNSGRIVVLCHAGNRFAWPERSGQDLVATFSDDGGKTWSNPLVAAEDGNYSIQSHGLVYDAKKDRLICLYTVYRWDYSIVKGRGTEASAPAIKLQIDAGEDLNRQYMVTSDDGGETWSKPRDITSMMPVKDGNGHFGSSEGRQITLGKNAGRLLVPGGIRCEDDKGNVVTEKTLHVWISDDHGETWKASDPIIKTDNTRQYSCEARVTELANGTLLYNVRTRYSGRQLAISKDAGQSWTSLHKADDLKATQCNGSMMTIRNANGKLTNTLLCSLPTPGGRKQGVVYVSFDAGKTWPLRHDVIVGFFAYSSILQVDKNTVGLFYEDNHYRDIRFVRLPINLLMKK